MRLHGNQMVHSWNKEIISLAYWSNSNKLITILTKRARNYFLILLVTILITKTYFLFVLNQEPESQ